MTAVQSSPVARTVPTSIQPELKITLRVSDIPDNHVFDLLDKLKFNAPHSVTTLKDRLIENWDKDYFNSRLSSAGLSLAGAIGLGLLTVGILGAIGVFPPAAIAALVVIGVVGLVLGCAKVGDVAGGFLGMIASPFILTALSLYAIFRGIKGLILGPEAMANLAKQDLLQVEQQFKAFFTKNHKQITQKLEDGIREKKNKLVELQRPVTITEIHNGVSLMQGRLSEIRKIESEIWEYENALKQVQTAVSAVEHIPARA